jgi:hypothetical protein
MMIEGKTLNTNSKIIHQTPEETQDSKEKLIGSHQEQHQSPKSKTTK